MSPLVELLWRLSDLTIRSPIANASPLPPLKQGDETAIESAAYCLHTLASPCPKREIWDVILRQLMHASWDARATVRNCAVKSLTSALTSHGAGFGREACIKSGLPIISSLMTELVQRRQEIATAGGHRVPTTTSFADAGGGGVRFIVHHSRDTEEKQWNETATLVFDCVLRTIIEFYPILGLDEIWKTCLHFLLLLMRTLSSTAEGTEVIVSALRVLEAAMTCSFSQESHQIETQDWKYLQDQQTPDVVECVKAKDSVAPNGSTCLAFLGWMAIDCFARRTACDGGDASDRIIEASVALISNVASHNRHMPVGSSFVIYHLLSSMASHPTLHHQLSVPYIPPPPVEHHRLPVISSGATASEFSSSGVFRDSVEILLQKLGGGEEAICQRSWILGNFPSPANLWDRKSYPSQNRDRPMKPAKALVRPPRPIGCVRGLRFLGGNLFISPCADSKEEEDTEKMTFGGCRVNELTLYLQRIPSLEETPKLNHSPLIKDLSKSFPWLEKQRKSTPASFRSESRNGIQILKDGLQHAAPTPTKLNTESTPPVFRALQPTGKVPLVLGHMLDAVSKLAPHFADNHAELMVFLCCMTDFFFWDTQAFKNSTRESLVFAWSTQVLRIFRDVAFVHEAKKESADILWIPCVRFARLFVVIANVSTHPLSIFVTESSLLLLRDALWGFRASGQASVSDVDIEGWQAVGDVLTTAAAIISEHPQPWDDECTEVAATGLQLCNDICDLCPEEKLELVAAAAMAFAPLAKTILTPTVIRSRIQCLTIRQVREILQSDAVMGTASVTDDDDDEGLTILKEMRQNPAMAVDLFDDLVECIQSKRPEIRSAVQEVFRNCIRPSIAEKS